MVTKAIVEEVVSDNSVRVRIPLIHKISTSALATPFSELPIASICTTPGIHHVYQVGDIIYVSYENNISSNIVVLGELQVNFDTESYALFNCVIDGGSW